MEWHIYSVIHTWHTYIDTVYTEAGVLPGTFIKICNTGGQEGYVMQDNHWLLLIGVPHFQRFNALHQAVKHLKWGDKHGLSVI